MVVDYVDGGDGRGGGIMSRIEDVCDGGVCGSSWVEGEEVCIEE
mgnify:CR=1 FL=1